MTPTMVTGKRMWGAMHRVFRKGALTQGPRRTAVAFTFDDGPDPAFTPRILDVLDGTGAKGTFFVLGEHLAAHRQLAREMVARGHELASHLYSHDRGAAEDDERFVDEMVRTRDLIAEVTGAAPRFMRFPFAHLGRQHPVRVFDVFGMQATHWSFSGMDSRLQAKEIATRVIRLLYPGAIVLLHDGVGNFSKYAKNRRATVDALPAVLEKCLEMGLAPVTLSALMGMTEKEENP